jgi:hypothetical protein
MVGRCSRLKIQLVVHGGDSFGGVKMIISMVAFGVATIGAASAGKRRLLPEE